LARHGERRPATGSADAVVGFANICSFVRSDMGRSQTLDQSAGRNFGTTMELAVFGRSRVESEIAAARVSTLSAAGGPWEIKDISASGFRLYAPMSIAGELALSMLVAIRRQGEEAWVMGIIRRIRRLTTKDAEIGLQLIANSLASAELTEQKKSPDASYSVNGENPALKGRQFLGLYLSFQRRPDETPVQSLVVPSGEYHPSRRYTLRTAGSVRTIRHGRLLEEHRGWVWTVIDNVTPESDLAAPRPPA
jgi:hypothetical protein